MRFYYRKISRQVVTLPLRLLSLTTLGNLPLVTNNPQRYWPCVVALLSILKSGRQNPDQSIACLRHLWLFHTNPYPISTQCLKNRIGFHEAQNLIVISGEVSLYHQLQKTSGIEKTSISILLEETQLLKSPKKNKNIIIIEVWTHIRTWYNLYNFIYNIIANNLLKKIEEKSSWLSARF